VRFTRRSPSNRELLLAINRKVNDMSVAIEALAADVAALEGAETAAVAELAALATEVTELKAGTITEAEVDSLAEKVSSVTQALKAGTEAA
jgi:outer membrane murein-binding lipoprotein Lpp